MRDAYAQGWAVSSPVSWKRRIVFGLAAVLTIVAVLALLRLMENARHDARIIRCVHNLKLISISLKMYANENDGRFPDKLSALYPKYLHNLEFLICPELRAKYKAERGTTHPFSANPSPGDIDALSSYAYVPGHKNTDAADVVIVYEKVDNHFGKGRSLLYLDGHGAWEPPENWRDGPPNTTLPPGF